MVRALSAGKFSSYREGAQIPGVWTSLLAEDEGQKQDLSQKLCCFGLSQKLLASVVHTLTCTDSSQRDPGTKMAPPGALASPPGQGRHLTSGRKGAWMSGARNGVCLRDLVGVHQLCTQVTQCWCRPEGTCDPGQAGFPAFLMLSQVPCDWIGTEVVFHSLV